MTDSASSFLLRGLNSLPRRVPHQRLYLSFCLACLLDQDPRVAARVGCASVCVGSRTKQEVGDLNHFTMIALSILQAEM